MKPFLLSWIVLSFLGLILSLGSESEAFWGVLFGCRLVAAAFYTLGHMQGHIDEIRHGRDFP